MPEGTGSRRLQENTNHLDVSSAASGLPLPTAACAPVGVHEPKDARFHALAIRGTSATVVIYTRACAPGEVDLPWRVLVAWPDGHVLPLEGAFDRLWMAIEKSSSMFPTIVGEGIPSEADAWDYLEAGGIPERRAVEQQWDAHAGAASRTRCEEDGGRAIHDVETHEPWRRIGSLGTSLPPRPRS